MEVCNPKGGRTAAPAFPAMLLLIMMLLINSYCCGASVLAKSNNSFRCSDGRLDECLIEEDLELELGFLMNPYVSRILAGSDDPKFPKPTVKNKPAFDIKTCGKPGDSLAYRNCISKIKDPQNKKGCNAANYYPRGDCQ